MTSYLKDTLSQFRYHNFYNKFVPYLCLTVHLLPILKFIKNHQIIKFHYLLEAHGVFNVGSSTKSTVSVCSTEHKVSTKTLHSILSVAALPLSQY